MALVDVDRLKQSGQKFVSGFTPGQKVMSVLGIAGLAVAMFMFTKWSAKPNYSPLFSNLSAKDAGFYLTLLWGGMMIGRFIGSVLMRKVPAETVLAGVSLGAFVLAPS